MQIHQEQGVLHIAGEVSVRTLNRNTWQNLQNYLKNNIQEVDFSAVTRADSATLSLILQILRQSPKPVKFHALPQAILDLAKLYEVETWIQS